MKKDLVVVIIFLMIGTITNAQHLFKPELELPVKGISYRVTQRTGIKPGEKISLFEKNESGAIVHWWLTCNHGINMNTGKDWAHELKLRIYYDEINEPLVDMTLPQFFGILMEKEIFTIDNAAIKVLPLNAFNCYFPIPFEKIKMELINTGKQDITIWFMADWQKYSAETNLTKQRFTAIHSKKSPGERFGSIQMAELEGDGFIAGMFQAVSISDTTDAWYHTGGETFLLDGETTPRVIRGIGGEDVFNMSFGIWPVQTDWIGAPLTVKKKEDDQLGSGYEGVMYRIFGPDPLFFNASASLRFGTKANHTESLVYAYLERKTAPKIRTPKEWKIGGPFECNTYGDFLKKEWPEEAIESWPQNHLADFGQYISNLKGMKGIPTNFSVPQKANYERGWCDFVNFFRGRRTTNVGAQPSNVSAYALGEIHISEEGKYTMDLFYDDWIKVWIDQEEVYSGTHEKGFEGENIELFLTPGTKKMLVKLSNFDNMEWRNWAFNLKLNKL